MPLWTKSNPSRVETCSTCSALEARTFNRGQDAIIGETAAPLFSPEEVEALIPWLGDFVEAYRRTSPPSKKPPSKKPTRAKKNGAPAEDKGRGCAAERVSPLLSSLNDESKGLWEAK